MDVLQERVAALKVLGQRAPRPDRLAQVREALEDKFEGVQAAAIKMLGSWGDAESCRVLRTFLLKAFERPRGLAVRGVAIKALTPLIGKDDVDWVLDLYFGLPEVLTKHEVLPLVLALPAEGTRKQLIRALRDDDPANRQAAVKAIGNMDYEDRRQLILPLRDDPDDFVRASAQALSR